MLRTSPPTSSRERLSRPASSPKILRCPIRWARYRASSDVSSTLTPTSATIPTPIRPIGSPASWGGGLGSDGRTRTAARRTRCSTARIPRAYPHPENSPDVMAHAPDTLLRGVAPKRRDGAIEVLEGVVEVGREPHDTRPVVDDDAFARQRRHHGRRVGHRDGDDPS